MNLKKLLFSTLLIFSILSVFSQSASEAETLFNNKQYSKAKSMYEALLKKKTADQLLNYRYARCCFELKDYENAARFFELSSSKYPQRDVYLADSYYFSYQFSQAVELYNSCLSALDPNDKKAIEIQKRIQQSETGAKLLNRVEDITLIDSIVVPKNDFLQYIGYNHDIGSLTSERIRVASKNQFDKVTYTTQRADRKILSDTVAGNTDILSAYKLLESWTMPTSISEVINTKANENYPFLLLDGVTLYYASDGNGSLGGYDIFFTKYSPNAKDFLNPENAGFPFNSPFNDYMMVLDEISQKGWFVSDRYLPAGKVGVYTFVLNDSKTYIRTDDSTLLRLTAQMKKVRKAPKQIQDQNRTNTTNSVVHVADFRFIINDSIVYNSKNQFKNPESEHLMADLLTLQQQLDNNSFQLEQLRYQYANSDNPESMAKIAETILILEAKQIQIQREINGKTKRIRLLEINFSEKS